MNKTIARMWIRALRSGKYRQGTGHLKKMSGQEVQHCCLGVLCELYNESMKRNAKRSIRTSDEEDEIFSLGVEHLPLKVMKWAGVGCEIGGFTTKRGKDICLAELNDEGTSFRKIAQIIERNAEEI